MDIHLAYDPRTKNTNYALDEILNFYTSFEMSLSKLSRYMAIKILRTLRGNCIMV